MSNMSYVQYAEDVLNNEISASKYVRLACQKFADEIENGCEGYYFDVAEADKYLTFFAKFLALLLLGARSKYCWAFEYK